MKKVLPLFRNECRIFSAHHGDVMIVTADYFMGKTDHFKITLRKLNPALICGQGKFSSSDKPNIWSIFFSKRRNLQKLTTNNNHNRVPKDFSFTTNQFISDC